MNESADILGLAEEHDAGVALVSRGKLVWAANEERYSRKKFQTGTPVLALGKLAGLLKREGKPWPTQIAIGSSFHVDTNIGDFFQLPPFYEFIEKFMSATQLDRWLWGSEAGALILKILAPIQQLRRRRQLARALSAVGITNPKFHFIDHHLAHAAGAYYTSGWDKCLVVTFDASGDGYCSKIFRGANGRLAELEKVPFYHSPGYYYGYVTQILGFKLGREGKVTGLAASGNPDKTFPIFWQEMRYVNGELINYGKFRKAEIRRLTEKLAGFSREDVSAGIQKHLELTVLSFLRDRLKKYARGHPVKLAVAGGIFANVRLNQKVAALPGVASLWVYPHMGDGGLAAGAALALSGQRGLASGKLPHVYLGDRIEEAEIKQAFKKHAGEISLSRPSKLAEKIASLLFQGKVVAVVRGAMEYGPRALGHRTLLYQATDPSVNDWLNKRLRRSEFMPFAPILLAPDLSKYFTHWQKVLPSLPYMTVTVDCNRRCRREAPAIVHVDGTARPQIVRKETEPLIYEVLQAYRRLTGRRVLINTSYNIHEEPIVRTPEDAVKTFLDGHLDYLVLDNYLVHLKRPVKNKHESCLP